MTELRFSPNSCESQSSESRRGRKQGVKAVSSRANSICTAPVPHGCITMGQLPERPHLPLCALLPGVNWDPTEPMLNSFLCGTRLPHSTPTLASHSAVLGAPASPGLSEHLDIVSPLLSNLAPSSSSWVPFLEGLHILVCAALHPAHLFHPYMVSGRHACVHREDMRVSLVCALALLLPLASQPWEITEKEGRVGGGVKAVRERGRRTRGQEQERRKGMLGRETRK